MALMSHYRLIKANLKSFSSKPLILNINTWRRLIFINDGNLIANYKMLFVAVLFSFMGIPMITALIRQVGIISALLAAVATQAEASASATSANPMVIKYHDSNAYDYHHAYHFELIRHILEVTRPEFGDYTVEPYSQAPTAKRQASLLNEGKLLNVHWAPPGTEIALADVSPIPVDILNGLQGYRVCMINAQAAVNFTAINDVQSLKNLRIAQGSSWAELPLYHFNGITPMEPPILGGLYPMLGLKRFDCIPLGVNEITTLHELEKTRYPFLAIEPSLLIVYDFPIYFYVSKKFPEIAKRFELGLKKLVNNGEFEKLFSEYHEKNLTQLNLTKRKIICLKSPFISVQRQCEQPFVLPDFIKQAKP